MRTSAHFRLETVGPWRSERLEREALEALERWYRRYMIAFELEPPQPIRVRLYPDRLFHAFTGAPVWADGAYDRREGIRVASGGVARLQGEMERVLAHELAHAFITEGSAGRAPRWLQEGLAQALAPLDGADPLAPGDPLPDSPDELDYPGCHAFVAALLRDHGTAPLMDLLDRLGGGEGLDEALRAELGAPRDDLYHSWREARLPEGAAARLHAGVPQAPFHCREPGP